MRAIRTGGANPVGWESNAPAVGPRGDVEVEQIEIRDHLQQHPPFDALPLERVNEVARQVEVAYYRKGTPLVQVGDRISALCYVRSGSVEIRRAQGEFFNRLDEGEIFGQLALITGKPARFSVRAREDALIYFLPEGLFHNLCDEEDSFAEFVEVEDRTRLRQAASVRAEASQFATIRVGRLVRSRPVAVAESTTVRAAAELISEHGISSLVVGPDAAFSDVGTSVVASLTEAQVTGIVTTEDLVTRVLAEGLRHDRPVADVMTPNPIRVESDSFLFEALNLMLRHNIHYLPVTSRGELVGVIDLADVVGLETQNSLFVVRSIFIDQSVDDLVRRVPDVQACFVRMVNEDATSHMIGSAISAIGRSFKQRLVELAETQLGPPPVPYCLLALGSMARDEQIMYSDQDNALVLSDEYVPGEHAEYFTALADFVCEALIRLGYRKCKGGFMASNPRWRKSLSEWKDEFRHWIERPRPEALLHGSVFFDLDGAAGETRLADELKGFIAETASRFPRFLGCLARNAQNRTPPLGFFRDFVLEKSGRYQETINLKRRGTAPLVDVVRVHALAAGSLAQNSFRRLDDVRSGGFLTSGMAADLRDALEFISMVRVRHQARALENGRRPDNNLDPESLSGLDRRSLKDAFRVLSYAQKFIKLRYRI